MNQNPIRLYFLLSAGSPCGCSFDDQAARLCMCVRPVSLRTHAFAGDTWNVSPCTRLHLQSQEWSDRRRRNGGGGDNLGCCLQPALSAASCSAQLRSVKPRIYTASAMRARRRERRREGDTERRGAPHTPARTNCGLSVSLSSRQRHTPFSLTVRRHNLNAEVKIPTRALSPSLSLDPIFVRLPPPPSLLLLFFSFFFF